MSIPIEGICEPRFEKVREVFTRAFEDDKEVGAAIAFSLDGEMVVDLWGGHTTPARTTPWAYDTMVNTYSTTKGMTSICAHRLVEQGLLDLDAPVASYWPEFAAAGKGAIPVRWLLSHQAGLPAIREALEEGALYDWEAMTRALAAETPWWEPGTKHGYHPVTFGHLVGEVIRRVSGRSVGQFFREEIAEPLGADFQIGVSASDDARIAPMIGSIAGSPTRKPEGGAPTNSGGARPKGPMIEFLRDMSDPTTMVGAAFNNPRWARDAHNTRAFRGAEIPAANGHGTARALARIYGTLACGGSADGVRILESATIERARREQAEGPDATLGGMPIRYGLGFMLQSRFMPFSPSPNAFGHPGAGGSIGMADPDAKVGFGYVMNRMKPALVGGPTGYGVLKAFFDAL